MRDTPARTINQNLWNLKFILDMTIDLQSKILQAGKIIAIHYQLEF